ncbi:alkaline phosphatase [soil metagenome]
MRIDRRRALSMFALGAIAAPDAASAKAAQAYRGKIRFDHGVASGDPTSDGVLLWTRVTPVGDAGASIPVSWEVATDAVFARVVSRGATRTDAGRDWTVKAEANGLKPGTDHHYRFRVGAAVSPTGRAKTLPVGPVADVVLAVTTCALYPAGFFNAYAHMAAAERLDAVIELGDYIYEYGAEVGKYGMEAGRKLGRIPEPAHDIVTLADYRTRYAQYRREPELQAAHARAAWICIWDDHETANDSWAGGAENHDASEGPWIDRERAALRAYYEWMPIRDPQPGKAFEAINRSFAFGDLASVIMLESRLMARAYQLELSRDGDITQTVYVIGEKGVRTPLADRAAAAAMMRAGPLPAGHVLGPDLEAVHERIWNPDRQMLGPVQEQWLAQEMQASVKAGRPWQVLGSGTVMAKRMNPDVYAMMGEATVNGLITRQPPEQRKYAQSMADSFRYRLPFELDSWNGYPAARERVYDAVKTAGPAANALVISGDSHAFWGCELHDEAGLRVATELGSSSVTSPSLGDQAGGVQIGAVFTAQNKEVKFCDQLAKGYMRLTLTPGEAKTEMIAVPHLVRTTDAKTLATFRVRPTKTLGSGPLERVTG